MNKQTKRILISALLILSLALAAVVYSACDKETIDQAESNEQSKAVSHEASNSNTVAAPDFTVLDEDGNQVKLSDYKGKPVVLNFWATWCGYCKMEMPDFDEKHQELGSDVQFLMINLTDGKTETVEGASSFIASMGYTFPVFYDTSSMAAALYGVSAIPTTFFIDAEGYAIAQATGAIDGNTLQTGIDLIYKP